MYPRATERLITADGGGINSARARRWQAELQRLADETGLRMAVSHLPPGTSKWNKIEHRMFCHITANWRGQPLLSREVIVSQPHWQYPLLYRATHPGGPRCWAISDWYPGECCRDGGHAAGAIRLPR